MKPGSGVCRPVPEGRSSALLAPVEPRRRSISQLARITTATTPMNHHILISSPMPPALARRALPERRPIYPAATGPTYVPAGTHRAFGAQMGARPAEPRCVTASRVWPLPLNGTAGGPATPHLLTCSPTVDAAGLHLLRSSRTCPQRPQVDSRNRVRGAGSAFPHGSARYAWSRPTIAVMARFAANATGPCLNKPAMGKDLAASIVRRGEAASPRTSASAAGMPLRGVDQMGRPGQGCRLAHVCQRSVTLRETMKVAGSIPPGLG